MHKKNMHKNKLVNDFNNLKNNAVYFIFMQGG